MIRIPPSLRQFPSRILGSLFEKYGESDLQKRVFVYSAFSIFLFGLWKWAQFSRFGNIRFIAADWYKELAFYNIIRQSLIDGSIPYHADNFFHGTNRFFTLPELVFSPQILILLFTDDIGLFFLFHSLVLYTVGFAGCIAIQRFFKLSTFSFIALVGLFSFNGYITSHLAVGHVMWGGYFFLPWFFLALIKLTEGKRSTRTNALWIAMVLFLIWLQGSLHILVGCLIYLVLFAIFNTQYIRVISLSLAFTFVLNFFRLFPTIISFTQHDLYFQSGYPTIRDLIDAFTVIKQPSIDMIGGITGALYWWEMDVFIGVLGLVFLVYFGLYMALRQKDLDIRFGEFTFPNLIIALFAINHFYSLIANLPIPLASVERVPSRLMIFPIVAILIFACVRFDGYFQKLRKTGVAHWLALAALIETYFELMTHLRYWNVESINSTLPAAPVLKIMAINVPNEQFYINSVRYSLVVSALGLLAWVVLILLPERDRQTAR